MKEFLEKIKVLDATTLKIIAIISMTIDHAGYIFFDNNFIMRSIGRIAMPVFSFFISEGYTKTRNKKKYLARLGIFSLISEVPFDLAFFSKLTFKHQNIMLSFFLSVLALMLFDAIRGEPKPGNTVYSLPRTLTGIVTVGCIGIIASLLRTDYGLNAVMCVLLFYLFINSKQWLRSLSGTAYLALMQTKLPYVFSGLAFFPLTMYNGKKGKGLKWLFYIFYPGHLMLFFLINKIFF